ncbi:unnamed protein product [Amoebophrya sp. A120]|nr:unnamed protein product [Amoebophrya sp. A120]|eukprot:GSA120T00017542001.1
MGVLRSEPMRAGTLVLPVEGARQMVDAIGYEVNLQFRDEQAGHVLPSARPYKRYTQRIEELERIVRFLREELASMFTGDVESPTSTGMLIVPSSPSELEGPLLARDGGADPAMRPPGGVESFLRREASSSSIVRSGSGRGERSAGLANNESEAVDGYTLDKVEAALRGIYADFVSFQSTNSGFVQAKNAAVEEIHVLQTVYGLEDLQGLGSPVSERRTESAAGSRDGTGTELPQVVVVGRPVVLTRVTGTISELDRQRFQRFLFRATLGNAFSQFQDLPTPLEDPKKPGRMQEARRTVFILYFQDQGPSTQNQNANTRGHSGSYMREKMLRLCQQFGAHLYDVVEEERAPARLRALRDDIRERTSARAAGATFLAEDVRRLKAIQPVSHNPLLDDYAMFLQKEKAIYATLNFFQGEGALLRCDVWYPVAEEDRIRQLLLRASSSQVSSMLVSDRLVNDWIDEKYHHGPTAELRPPDPLPVPPTFFRSNELTGPFQELVFTYGIPRYQEVSPVLFSVVTFPFLFGVMFGDVGHGGLLLLVGLYLVYADRAGGLNLPKSVLRVRYMILLMGVFAFYAGWMYNDFFGVGTNVFGSRWEQPAMSAGPRQSASSGKTAALSSGRVDELGGSRSGAPVMQQLLPQKRSTFSPGNIALEREDVTAPLLPRSHDLQPLRVGPSSAWDQKNDGTLPLVEATADLREFGKQALSEDELAMADDRDADPPMLLQVKQKEHKGGSIPVRIEWHPPPMRSREKTAGDDETPRHNHRRAETRPLRNDHDTTEVEQSPEDKLPREQVMAESATVDEAEFPGGFPDDEKHEQDGENRSTGVGQENERDQQESKAAPKDSADRTTVKMDFRKKDTLPEEQRGALRSRVPEPMVPRYDVWNGAAPSQTKPFAYAGPYPFGIDPAWTVAQNKLLFLNSLKMKLSVLFGVSQMAVGVLLRWANALHDRSALDFLFECLPMMTFLVCFFGYMDYMILQKWVHTMPEQPSIINCLINLAFGNDNRGVFFAHEGYLMLTCLLCVPVLLVPKPTLLYLRHKREKHRIERLAANRDEEELALASEELAQPHFDAGEVIIHQVIETIEFVLGTVSHTASYLRQWALSLAHAQLSEVFLQYTLQVAMASFAGNWVGRSISIFVAFAVWFAVTCAVLMAMDSLECFLHTLRLHWVEFQSKFYRADGHLFQPFRHTTTLSSAEHNT